MALEVNGSFTAEGALSNENLIHYYKLGEIKVYQLEGEPICDDSWTLVPGIVLWNRWIRGGLYIAALSFLFVGIAIASDIFMSSIEMITSKKRIVKFYDAEAQVMQRRDVLIWNETVANLTLMALGSSAPEILLATLEAWLYLGKDDQGGKDGLGVFTIIGSAGFNLLIIIAVCISSVGNDIRRIKQFGVFTLTSLWSMFAYIWLLIVLEYISPGEIEFWEAVVTLAYFPLLVSSAYYTDQLSAKKRKRKRSTTYRDHQRRPSGGQGETVTNGHMLQSMGSNLRRQSIAQIVSELASPSTVPTGGTNTVPHAQNGHTHGHDSDVAARQQKATVEAEMMRDQMKDQAIVKWQQMKIFNNRYNTSIGDERLTQLVNFLTQSHEIDRLSSKSGKPQIVFLSPQMITPPGEVLAKVDVFLANSKLPFQQRPGMRRSLSSKGENDGRGENMDNTLQLYGTKHQSNGSPRLSLVPLDSAYGSTTSVKSPNQRRRSLSGVPPVEPNNNCILGNNIKDTSISEATAADDVPESEQEITVKFETRDASAKDGLHYTAVSGALVFSKDDNLKTINVPLMDNYLSSATEREFFVILHSPSRNAQLGRTSVTRVIVMPNTGAEVGFAKDICYLLNNNAKEIVVVVERYDALQSRVSVEFSTELDSAHGGENLAFCDFVSTSGTIVFEKNETSKEITIECKASPKKSFYVVLKHPIKCTISPEFGMTQIKLCTEDEDDSDSAQVLDVNGSDANSRVLKVVAGGRSGDIAKSENEWIKQIKKAFNVSGEDVDESGDLNLTWLDYLTHLISFPWKVLLRALIPPPVYYGGSITFFLALVAIGTLVVFVEEIGNLLGCVVGLENAITGITIIALGTSLPDTFASRTAAIHEPHADASIGNVTGSNSVNVFLGLGLPWVLTTVYNYYNQQGPFYVSRNNLSFSVTAFLIVGVICLATLIARRFFLGGELGGPKVWRFGTSVFLILLWLAYATVCGLKASHYF